MTTPTGSPTTFGGLGKLEWAPSNNPDDPSPTWVDITSFLRTENTALEITRGRQTELDTIQSSQLTCLLDNSDNRFTFGYTAGPYGSNWAPARKVRYSETIGGRTFVLFTGWIEYPDISDWQPIGYQEVALTCTDRLTRLGRGKPFVSTLGAHILGSPPAATMLGYWPLNDPAGSQLATPAVGSAKPAMFALPPFGGTGGLIRPGITFGTSDKPPADDLSSCVTWVWQADGTTSGYLYAKLDPTITMGSADQLVICAWVKPTALPLPVGSSDLGVVQLQNIGAGGFARLRLVGGAGASNQPGNFTAEIVNSGATWTGTVTGVAAPTDRWAVIAGAFQLAATQRLWADDVETTAAAVGSPPASLTFNSLYIGIQYQGAICHVQIYVGDPARFVFADFTAQRQVGLTGLEYQTTAQRINRILDYAGVPASDRAVDPGVSFMQKASLAGKDPGAALDNGVATEHGRGFIDGAGRYVFHDRTRIYNV